MINAHLERLDLERYSVALRWGVVGLCLCILALTSIHVGAFGLSLGDWVSERVVGTSATNASSFIISTDGAGPNVVGMGPELTIAAATAIDVGGGTTTATLNASLTDLNGAPRASAWFEYGETAALGASTPVQTLTSTGDFSATITGWNPANRVFFRAVSRTDGQVATGQDSFLASQGAAVAFRLLWTLVPLVLAASIIIHGLTTRNMLQIVVGIAIGLLALFFSLTMLETFF